MRNAVCSECCITAVRMCPSIFCRQEVKKLTAYLTDIRRFKVPGRWDDDYSFVFRNDGDNYPHLCVNWSLEGSREEDLGCVGSRAAERCGAVKSMKLTSKTILRIH